MAGRVETAIILAAGLGQRLSSVWDRPKGLLTFGKESLIERSLRLLKAHSMRRIVIVTGFSSDHYQPLAGPGVELVHSNLYATTGSMTSLSRALDVVETDFLLLESDIAYEARALEALANHPAEDVVLASGPTGATDEVWIGALQGRVATLSKEAPVEARGAEFTGLTKISAPLARLMNDALHDGHDPGMAYDTGALPIAARHRAVTLCIVPDLLWGEVDDAFHYERMRDRVWPNLDSPSTAEALEVQRL